MGQTHYLTNIIHLPSCITTHFLHSFWRPSWTCVTLTLTLTTYGRENITLKQPWMSIWADIRRKFRFRFHKQRRSKYQVSFWLVLSVSAGHQMGLVLRHVATAWLQFLAVMNKNITLSLLSGDGCQIFITLNLQIFLHKLKATFMTVTYFYRRVRS